MKRCSAYHTNKCALLPDGIRETLEFNLSNGYMSLRKASQWLHEQGYPIGKSIIHRWMDDGYPAPPRFDLAPHIPSHLRQQVQRLLGAGYTPTHLAELLNAQGYAATPEQLATWPHDNHPQLELDL